MRRSSKMKRRTVCFLLLAFSFAFVHEATAIELDFQTGNSANLFWIVDQLSKWDSRYTSPRYREYWDGKVKFSDQDYAVLDQYARMRRRLGGLDKEEVKKEISPWTSLLGSAQVLPHEQFALAFLETKNVNDAAALLNLSVEDKKILIMTLKHFARKMKDYYGVEVAHLKSFNQKARILITLADAGGFIDQMRNFYGVSVPLPQTIPVDVLWAPPGFVRPAHMDYHIILPVSVDHAETDEAVLQHLSMVVQEVGQYLLSKLPAETLAKASARLLSECGFINSNRPEMVREAIQVALGEVLFLRERFPDLPVQQLMVPWDNSLDYPYAVDELSRAFSVALRDYFEQASGFYPGFVARAVEIQRTLFPPVPKTFASTGLLYGDKDSRELFNGLFSSVAREEFDISDVRGFTRARLGEKGRVAFIVVTAQHEGNMFKALKSLSNWNKLSSVFRRLRKKSFIYPVTVKKAGVIFVVRGMTPDAVRKGLIELHGMTSMPAGPVEIK